MCEKYLQGVYVVFDNNDVFLADFVTALDYNDVYPKLFCYEGVSAEQWRSIIHGSGAGDIIIPSMTLSSKYIGENIPTVTYVVRSVAEQLVRNQSAICFILNEELLMRSFVSNEQYEQGCIELTDQTGKLLSRHGDVRDEDGVRLTRYSSDGSLSVSVIVPYMLFPHIAWTKALKWHWGARRRALCGYARLHAVGKRATIHCCSILLWNIFRSTFRMGICRQISWLSISGYHVLIFSSLFKCSWARR